MMRITRQTRPDDLPEWLTVRETSTYLGIGLSTIYRLVAEGRIPARRIGARPLIPRDYLITPPRNGEAA